LARLANDKPEGLISLFTDGIARGKPHDTYYRDVARATLAAQQTADTYKAGSSLG
jgi:hypothetical protein